jgi:NADH-quinone oxidoreductase subunit J
MEIAIFLLFAGVAIVSAANILIQRHPIYSALSLIVTFIALAGIYIQMHAEFIAVMQIVVYTGAIMVLFIFVIMLLNVGAEQARSRPGSRREGILVCPWRVSDCRDRPHRLACLFE